MADDGLTGLGRRSVLALGGAGVSGVATIATVLIAARILTETGAGVFFVAISVFAIAQGLASLGVETGLQFFIPTMPEFEARQLIRRSLIGSMLIGALVGIVVFIAADPVGSLLADGDTRSTTTTTVIRLTALSLPFAGLYEISMGALRACDAVFSSTLLDRIIRPTVQVGAMILAGVLGANATGMVLAWVVPNIAAVLVALILIPRVRLRRPKERNDAVSTEVFWRYTGPRAIARVCQVLTQRLDVLILAAVYSVRAAAVYGAVSRCMIAGVFVSTALRQTIQPQLRRLIVLGDPVPVKQMYGASTTWLVIVTWPVYLTMLTHAPLVMSAFGSEYESGATALVLLCSAMLVATGCGLVDVVLLMLGRSWLSTINLVLALVVNVILNFALAPSLGMVGSAIAWVASIMAANLIPLVQTGRVGLHPGGRPLWTSFATAILAVGVPLLVERLVFGDGLVPFVVAFTFSMVLYGASLIALRKPLLLDRLVSDVRRPRRARVTV